MSYRYDEDLEFLREVEDSEIDCLVKILIYDKNGSKRFAENLSKNPLYQQYKGQHSKYLDLILEELQTFGGNSFANILRGGGVYYKEILCDVCDKMKVDFDKSDSASAIEQELLMKIIADSMDKMSDSELRALANELDLGVSSYSKQVLLLSMQTLIRAGGFMSYQIALIVANAISQAIIGEGLSLAANAALTRAIGIFAGPIGLAITGIWAAIDIAGPAYRVTIPAVIQVAYLRQLHLHNK